MYRAAVFMSRLQFQMLLWTEQTVMHQLALTLKRRMLYHKLAHLLLDVTHL